MLNCSVFVLQSPEYLGVILGTGAYVIFHQNHRVTQHSDQGHREADRSFLQGCSKQQLFLNPFQTSKSKGKGRGLLFFAKSRTCWSFCDRGSKGIACYLITQSDNWREILEILLLKNTTRFSGQSAGWFFSPAFPLCSCSFPQSSQD